ncbi:MAG TPA: cyclic nucleotide-binding and patatin-like phospholipase domain-containing protein [Candidatus Binatus sp.]|nr:cyclic nucleotide-binding and patatin-like phospholipase domain-containing protein [Candidatus Binatus sp.]
MANADTMFPQDKLAELKAAPFFAALSRQTLEVLLPELRSKVLPGGAVLFRQGELGDSMFFVLSGRLRVAVPHGNHNDETFREIARGESVGELALLTGEPRSATIRAIRDSHLAQLSRTGFEHAIQTDPTLIRHITVQLASRQRQASNGELRGNIRTVSVLPIGHSTEAQTFAAQLASELANFGPAPHINRAILKDKFGFEFSAARATREDETRMAACLDELETDHHAIVYEADSDLTAWTKRCVRQADLILVVGSVNAVAPEQCLQLMQNYFNSCAITARVELVLLHEGEFSHGIHTARWLNILAAAAHHHILRSDRADIAKLARLITGNAIGLVLSGGGARGFAHIGVIRALTERAIPIDYIGGTSMGAVIAAQHASGWDWPTMARVNQVEWPRCEPQKNYTFPLVALNSARRMDQLLEKMFGAVEIENLRTKFFCVSTNLTTAKANIHRQGRLWKAVRASMSIPGIGPPAIERGEILVDGGLVDNLPVDTMKSLCRGWVLAVDVSEQVEFKSKLSESYTVSGWKLMRQQLNPWSEKPDLPNILHTLYRTTTVGGLRAIESAKSHADLCFEPPVGQFGVFDWRSVEKIIDVGYRYALAKLADENAAFGITRGKCK